MQIDWFTLIAQIINFLILLVLLKYVLFDRIVKAMDKRQERISSQIQKAEEKEQQAQETLDEYESKKQNLEKERRDILNKAKKEVNEQRQEWKNQAREDVDKQRQGWLDALQNQRQEFATTLRRESGTQVYEIARKVLADMADQSLEAQLAQMFEQRLEALETDDIKALDEAVQNTDDPILIQTTFQLEKDLQSHLQDTINEILENKAEITFETTDRLVAGIELNVGDQKIDWSIDQYLDSLETMFNDLLEEQGTAKESDESDSPETEKSKAEEKSSNEGSDQSPDSSEKE